MTIQGCLESYQSISYQPELDCTRIDGEIVVRYSFADGAQSEHRFAF